MNQSIGVWLHFNENERIKTKLEHKDKSHKLGWAKESKLKRIYTVEDSLTDLKWVVLFWDEFIDGKTTYIKIRSQLSQNSRDWLPLWRC